MTSPFATYAELLAAEAAQLREAHGNNPRWWMRHDQATCPICIAEDEKLTRALAPPKHRCKCPTCGKTHYTPEGSIS